MIVCVNPYACSVVNPWVKSSLYRCLIAGTSLITDSKLIFLDFFVCFIPNKYQKMNCKSVPNGKQTEI